MKQQSNRSPSCLMRGINILLAAGFILSTVFAVIGFNIEFVLFNPKTYKQTLENRGIYAQLPGLAASQIVHSLSSDPCSEDPALCEGEGPTTGAGISNLTPFYLQNLGIASWEYLLGIFLPQAWLKTQSESLVDQVFAGLKTDTPIRPTLSLVEIKANVNDSKLDAIVQTLLAAAQPCSEAQLFTITSIALGVINDDLPICIPNEELRPLLEDELRISLRQLIQDIPAQINIDLGGFSSSTDDPTQSGSLRNKPRSLLRNIRLVFVLSPLLPAIFLALIALTSVRSWRALGRRWGIPVLMAGLLAIMLAAAILMFFSAGLNTFLMPQITGNLSENLSQLLLSVTKSITIRYVLWVGVEAGIIFLVGGSLLVFSTLLDWKKASTGFKISQ